MSLAAIIGLAGQTAMRTIAYKSWAPTLESELAIGRDNPGRTFVNADLIAPRDSRLFAWRIRPTLHAAQTAALASRGAGLSSPLPSTRYFGYFPLQYSPAHDFLRAMADWEAKPDAVSLGKFRNSNRGAPQVLIVSSSGEDGTAFARRLGYTSCKASQSGGRDIAACTVSTEMSATSD